MSVIDHNEILKKAEKVFELESVGTVHGKEHWFRVWANALILSKHIPECDKEIAILFALLHDCKRVNEFVDPDHGLRAAKYTQELYEAGELCITTDQLNQLKFAMVYHNCGYTTNEPTMAVCWDADRLDLPRVGKILIPELFSTDTAKKMILDK